MTINSKPRVSVKPNCFVNSNRLILLKIESAVIFQTKYEHLQIQKKKKY